MADQKSVITLRALRQRQNSLRDILGHNSGITTHRYFRLLAISVIEILCTVPLATYVVIYDAVVLPIYPWRGLADLHYGFSRIDQYPISLWTTQPPIQRSIEINEWIVIGCAILYFLLFGLTEEARKHYKSAFILVAGVVGLPTTKYARNNVRYVL